jgi:hypothetical protein
MIDKQKKETEVLSLFLQNPAATMNNLTGEQIERYFVESMLEYTNNTLGSNTIVNIAQAITMQQNEKISPKIRKLFPMVISLSQHHTIKGEIKDVITDILEAYVNIKD